MTPLFLLVQGVGPTTVPEPPTTSAADLMQIALLAAGGLLLLGVGALLVSAGRRTRERILLRGPIAPDAHEADPWNL